MLINMYTFQYKEFYGGHCTTTNSIQQPKHAYIAIQLKLNNNTFSYSLLSLIPYTIMINPMNSQRGCNYRNKLDL